MLLFLVIVCAALRFFHMNWLQNATVKILWSLPFKPFFVLGHLNFTLEINLFRFCNRLVWRDILRALKSQEISNQLHVNLRLSRWEKSLQLYLKRQVQCKCNFKVKTPRSKLQTLVNFTFICLKFYNIFMVPFSAQLHLLWRRYGIS